MHQTGPVTQAGIYLRDYWVELLCILAVSSAETVVCDAGSKKSQTACASLQHHEQI